MEKLVELYKDYYCPVLLLDAGLNVAYKNGAAKVARLKPRVGANIKKFVDGENFGTLRDIAGGQVVRVGEDSCLARPCGDMLALVFFDSLDYAMQGADAETAAQVSAIAAKYGDLEQACAGDISKAQKVRMYLRRHMANFEPGRLDAEKNYCDIWEFMNRFREGLAADGDKTAERIKFDIEREDKIFVHRLNESDFLTLNFILILYSLTHSVFGSVNVKFETAGGSGAIIYGFFPGADFVKADDIDLELAQLIAQNNNLSLEFDAGEHGAGQEARVSVHFLYDGRTSSQFIKGNNIISAEDIAARSETELAFLNNV